MIYTLVVLSGYNCILRSTSVPVNLYFDEVILVRFPRLSPVSGAGLTFHLWRLLSRVWTRQLNRLTFFYSTPYQIFSLHLGIWRAAEVLLP